jgi:pantoate-beta-alanine ligase
VIKRLVDFICLKKEIQIVECPTIRETDGLAKSSRNILLSREERLIAPNIFKILKESIKYSKTHDINETHNKVVTDINRIEGLEVEYFEIVDGNTLLDVKSWEDSSYIVGCITVYCGKTPIRLIDHIKYRG